MDKIGYKKIVWGIVLMAIIFAAPFLLPRAGKALIHAYNALAQTSNAPHIDSIDDVPDPSGHPSAPVNVFGTGFTAGNTVNFGDVDITNVQSTDGTSLTFYVPQRVPGNATKLPDDNYRVQVSVTNDRGGSNALPYTMICDLGDCDTSGIDPGDGTTTPDTFPGPLYLCPPTHLNCIEGFKVPWNIPIVASQTVTVDNQYHATTTSWSFDDIPPGLHVIGVTVPPGWYSGFTVCINNISCHNDIPIQGNSVGIKFLTSSTRPPCIVDDNGVLNVPAGAYIDLYWHFSQNFESFGSAPTGCNGGDDVTGTSTAPARSQVDSYTAGGAANVQPGTEFVQGLLGTTVQSAPTALGCTIGNIITPAIRGTIAGDASLLADPKPVQSRGGGGASIIINDIGSQGPLRQLLPVIAGNTRQSANDLRYIRASTVGFPTQPSWDAVAYCLQNAMIKYINQATINWVDTAFNGNPAFIQNYGQFIKGIGNQTALTYFNKTSSYGSNAPFFGAVKQSLIEDYANKGNYADLYAYTGPDASFFQPSQPGRVGGFTSIQDLSNVVMNDGNNPYDRYFLERSNLLQEIADNEDSEEKAYQAGSGYSGVNAPNPPSTGGGSIIGAVYGQPIYANAPVSDPSKSRLIVPPITIQQTSQQALNQPYTRLTSATGYDQMVVQMVNNLINLALNKIFTGRR